MVKERNRNISVDFKVAVSREEQGRYMARCPSLPGLVATGRTQKEALDNIDRAIGEFLEFAAPLPFLPVCRDVGHPRAGPCAVFRGDLYCATSHDAVYRTASGDYGSWLPLVVSKTTSAFYNSVSGTGAEESGSGDYTPQIYALEAFTAFGTERLYASTNAMGGIYESEDGKRWKLNFSSGEERVHSLCAFGRKLYAGTSSRGAIYSYNGRSWGVAFATGEVAITALCAYADHVYAGTYPNGYIFRSRDGLKWDLAYRSRQSFIHDFVVNEGNLYACGGRADGAKIFRLVSAGSWKTVYHSDREQNIYCLGVFNGSVYAGCGEGGRLLRSLDGKRWETAFQSGQEGIRGISIFEGRMYLATERGGVIFRSESSEAAPPRIEMPEVSEITSCSVELRWNTDKPTYSTLEYGIGSTSEFTIGCRELKREHYLPLSGLKSGATYCLRARSDLASGNLSVSPEIEFTTLQVLAPELDSSSHTEEERWYSNNKLEFTVFAKGGAIAFFYALNRKKDYRPGVEDSRGDWGRLVIDGVEDGEWYLHLCAVDAAGNLSKATVRRQVRVDTKAEAPLLSSSSHPKQDTWYAKNDLCFEWRTKEELSGVKGYYYLLDKESGSLPGKDKGEWTEKQRLTCQGVADGIWYFHIVAVDKSGNISDEAAHYEVRIDTSAPQPQVVSESHADPGRWYSEDRLVLSWRCELDLSGVDGYYHHLDRQVESVFDEKAWKWSAEESAEFMLKEDGNWYFHICARDKAGNISEAACFPLRLDFACPAPSLSSSSHPDEKGWYSIGEAELAWQTPETLSGIRGYYYKLDTGHGTRDTGIETAKRRNGETAGRETLEKEGWVFTEQTSCKLPLPEEGEWSFQLLAEDQADNLSARAAGYRLGVDRSVGVAVIESSSHPSQESWYDSRKAELKWTGPEDVAGIKGYYYKLDTGHGTRDTGTETAKRRNGEAASREKLEKEGWTYTEKKTCKVDIAESGKWAFQLLAEDKAGNIGSEPAVYILAADFGCKQPLLSSLSHPDQKRWYSLRDAVLSWEEPEDVAGIKGYHYRLIPNDPTSPSGLRRASGTSAVANLLRTSRYEGQKAMADRRDTGHGKGAGDVQADGWSFTEELSVKVTIPEDGQWVFELQAEDGAGNRSGTVAYTVLADTVAAAPLLEASGQADPENWYNQESILVSIKSSRELSGVAGYFYQVDNQAATVPDAATATWTVESEIRLEPLDDGVWYVHALVKDGAGNVSDQAGHLRLRLDSTAPSVAVNPLPKFTKEKDFLVSWSGQDALSGLECFDVQVRDGDEGDYQDWLKQTERTEEIYRSAGSGFYYFRCRARDKAKNWSSFAADEADVARIGVDLDPPEAVLGLEAERKPGGEVRLMWRPAADEISGTAYYSVYRSGRADELGRMISVPGQVKETMFVDPGRDLAEEEKYYYTIQAVDAVGNECSRDNQRIAVVCDKMTDLPQLTSPTHNSPERWYAARKVVFRFKSGVGGGAEADGYYYLFDRNPGTELDAKRGRFTELSEVEVKAEVDGTHYFHLLPRYGADKPGRLTVHFRVNIDTAPPGKPEVKIESGSTAGAGEGIELAFHSEDYLSGVEGYYFVVDRRADGVPAFSGSQWTENGRAILASLEAGRNYAHIIAVDRAGNASAPAHFPLNIAGGENGVVRGNVLSYSGDAPASGELMLEGEGRKEQVRVEKNGNFNFAALRLGRYRLTWRAKRMPDLVIDYELKRPGEHRLTIYEELMLWPAVINQDSFLLIFCEVEESALLLETFDNAGKLMGKREFVKGGGVYHKILCDTARYPNGDYILRLSSRSAEDGRLLRTGQRVFSVNRGKNSEV